MLKIIDIEVNELGGFARVYYSDNTSLIVAIKNARELSEVYGVAIKEI